MDNAETQIGWNRLHAGRRGGHAVQRRVDPLAGFILDLRVAELVLYGIDQLDVTDRVRILLHLARHTWVAVTAQSNRPVDGRSLADLLQPVGTDHTQVVGEAKGRTGAVSAVDHDDVLVDGGQLRIV